MTLLEAPYANLYAAASNINTERVPCEHSHVNVAYQHKIIFQSNLAAAGHSLPPEDTVSQHREPEIYKRHEIRSNRYKNNVQEQRFFARAIVTDFVTKGDPEVITVTIGNEDDAAKNAAAVPTTATDSDEEDSDSDDGSSSESETDHGDSVAGGFLNDNTDLKECLDHYRKPANITALVFTPTIMDGSSVDVGSVTTVYNVSNHWGVSYEHPKVEMRIFEAEVCPPNATTNLWNIKFEKKEATPAEAASPHLPSCTEIISPDVKCTDEMSCKTSCALHVHHHNYLLIGLLSALGGMALTSLLGFTVAYCLRRRHRRRTNEKGAPTIPAVIIDSTPAHTDGNVDIELEPARKVTPASQPSTARSSLPERFRRHVSTPLSLSHRKGIFSYFNVGNASAPADGDPERRGDEVTSQDSSKSGNSVNGNEEAPNRDVPRLAVF